MLAFRLRRSRVACVSPLLDMKHNALGEAKMKVVSWVAAVVGMLVVLIAFYARYHGEQTISVLGTQSAAGSALLVGNTILLLAILFVVLDLQGKRK